MKRFELPGYDPNYRDASDYNTPAGQILSQLNTYLRANGIEGGIACLDEKGEIVRRYTDHVVLQIEDSVSPEQLNKIKEFVLQLLKTMGATESQLKEVFSEGNNQITELPGTNNKLRFSLPGYNTSYRDASDYNTPAGQILSQLNAYLSNHGIEGGIACLDEEGKTVNRYTNHVVLEIDKSVTPAQLEEIKQIASQLLSTMQ